jgi:nicotinamidase-related amidase
VAGLRWGDAHLAIGEHRPLSSAGWLARLVELRTPFPGDTYTVNVGALTHQASAPFTTRHAASLRAVHDLAALDANSYWVQSTGQSGSPFSGLYANMLPLWRAAGGQVIWLNWGVRADRLNLPAGVLFKAKVDAQGQLSDTGYAESSPLDRGPSLVPGHWGAQVVDELPVAATDITVFKHRLSGFYDNELDSLLRQQGISTLLFAGINTDRCVFSSLQDAGFLGYDCVLLEDACSTPSPAYVSRAILFLVEKLHGFVASAQALTVSLTPKGARS